MDDASFAKFYEPTLFQMGEGTAYGFYRETEIVGDIGPGHGQYDRISGSSGPRGAAG